MMENASTSPMRFVYALAQSSGAAVQSAVNTLARIEWLVAPPSWRGTGFWSNFGWLITTSGAVILSYLFAIPNASAFLLIAVMHSVFLGGYRAGLASACLGTLYTAIYLSNPGQLFRYNVESLRGLTGLTIAAFGTVFLVMFLRRSDVHMAEDAARRIRNLDVEDETEQRMRALADAAPVLLWMADLQGRRYFFNQPWLRFTGAKLDEVVGSGWERLIHPEDAHSVLNRFHNAVKGGERFELEYRVRGADDDYHWVQDLGSPRLGPDGQTLGYLGAFIDRTERKRVEKALHQLSGKLLEMQDDERRRISRELHDTTAQNLAVVSMNLCAVKEGVKMLNQRTRDAVAESLTLAERCSHEIRTLSYLLHPPLLDELGLASALRAYTTGYTQRTGIRVELKMDAIGRLPGEIETTLFRIIQEALTNVHRHSGSQTAEIRIVRDPKQVRLSVSDEGGGVPGDELSLISEGASVGVGIAGMRERAIQLGGQLKVASSSRGTTITAILPLSDAA